MEISICNYINIVFFTFKIDLIVWKSDELNNMEYAFCYGLK